MREKGTRKYLLPNSKNMALTAKNGTNANYFGDTIQVQGVLMKKTKFWAMLAIALAFGLAFVGCDSGSTGDDQGRPIVCLGDSLTAGYGATTPGVDDRTKSYPAYLQNKVNIPVINVGKSGDTTSGGLAHVDSGVLSHNLQIVIILLGGNDMGRGIPVTTARDNLQGIIDKINDGKRKIYLAKYYTEEIITLLENMSGSSMPGLPATYATLVRQYHGMFNDLASRNNLTLIDGIYDGVWGIHMSDVIHPNAAGYEVMANNIFNALKPYLQANDLLK